MDNQAGDHGRKLARSRGPLSLYRRSHQPHSKPRSRRETMSKFSRHGERWCCGKATEARPRCSHRPRENAYQSRLLAASIDIRRVLSDRATVSHFGSEGVFELDLCGRGGRVANRRGVRSRDFPRTVLNPDLCLACNRHTGKSTSPRMSPPCRHSQRLSRLTTTGCTMRKWIQLACDDIIRLRNRAGLWGYRSDLGSSVEATSLACLGLLSCHEAEPPQKVASAVKRGAEWMATMQNADGSLGVCASLPQPGWATPYAILLWSALDTLAPERQRAAAWLLAQKGLRPPVPDIARSPVGHDPALVGWPWIEKTHSWLEPTAMAILALNRLSLHDHARVDEGMLIITDRALAHGGWNPGGKAVFGRELRPQPGPTGIAMLALATRATKGRPERGGSGHHLSSSSVTRRQGPDLPGLGRARPPCLGCRAA